VAGVLKRLFMNPYVEAGVRVIFKRSLLELGLKFPKDITTAELIGYAIRWEAPVTNHAKMWLHKGAGRPDLSDTQRELFKAQAIEARRLWTEGKQFVRRSHTKN
jgi:hypothetical protein